MESDIMHSVAGLCVNAGEAVLHGYRCCEIVGETYPGVFPVPGYKTAGVLWSGVTFAGLQQLDMFEGEYYNRMLLNVRQGNNQIPAHVYVFSQSHRHLLADKDWNYATFRQTGKQQFIEQYVGFNHLLK
jgi:gamma-glutamylcyclotransferase (GGCT)/AIG2-like uncharacterized protein YtfP